MSKELIHFSKLTKKQIETMWNRAVNACIEYADEIGVSGLSDHGAHNIYTALHNALTGEWNKSKSSRKIKS